MDQGTAIYFPNLVRSGVKGIANNERIAGELAGPIETPILSDERTNEHRATVDVKEVNGHPREESVLPNTETVSNGRDTR